MTERNAPSKRRYFHLVTDAEWVAMKAKGRTWGWLMRHYLQPKWCGYPDALEGAMGCWSLIYRYVKGEDYCRNCMGYKGKQKEK